jgi:basic membrane protein A
VVPKTASEYAKDIQDFVDQKYDIIVTVGFNLGKDTTIAAKANPNTWFIGVDQSPICVDATGKYDTTFACKGDAKTLLPKYVSIEFKEDQAGYLAGIVAASVSKNGEIGAIGGTTLCAPCVRYIQGYELGAKSVNASIKVDSAYVTRDFSAAAFQDQPGGKRFAETFLTAHPKVDVLFQVAGLTGNGVLDAACAAGIDGIGVDVDQFLSYPAADKCLVTSAEKHLQVAVAGVIKAVSAGTATGGDNVYDATNDGIGVAPFHDMASAVPADLQGKLDTALAAMKSGSLQTCPATGCGVGPK